MVTYIFMFLGEPQKRTERSVFKKATLSEAKKRKEKTLKNVKI